ncbi:D-alanyl-D-alanine carboxypeptidase [Streptomyces sp. NPDC006367]|uniref:D-alanyl-D-alanine carboxypeptidase n=1 Tax=unclassified Streptomyces TaxID=2593676 RepID=UPI0033BAC0F0
MEEASVAGESPDRSKQRESSEEPTSGSAGPVPEARTEASEARDPRLAVARDAAKPAASAGAGESGGAATSHGGVDTATRVLTVPAADTGADAGTDTGADDETDAEGDAGADGSAGERSAEPSDTSGDGRLREAVAAWVATADERAAANTRHEAGSAASRSGEDADAAVDAPETPEAQEGTQDAAEGVDEAPADADDDRPRADEDADAPAAEDTDGPGREGAAPSAEDEPAPAAQDEPEAQDADESGETPVDQPTAVFKAPRPSAPAVDQPTTMLKLGDAAPKNRKTDEGDKTEKADKADKADKKAEGSEGKASGKAAPESESERTSKFVALRNPDDPATRKPPRPAPPAGPAQSSPSALPARSPQSPQSPRPDAEEPRTTPADATAAVPQIGPERTTQQPLPPKPPLDLLAELTNTPPPPETPLRTTVRRVKIWSPLVLLLVIVFGIVQAVRPLPAPTLHLTAQETLSFEGDKPSMPWPGQGQAAMDVNGIGTFGTSGDQKPVPIASIAKVMTVYLILRDHPLKPGEKGPEITVDAAAQKHYETGKAENESVVRVSEGQKITEYEALQAVMLPSANNIAKLLARWDTGSASEDAFVAKMNKTAEELGMKNTTYTDPSGLDKTTVSTAEDLVKLGRAAMENPVFKEISKQPSYVDLNGEKQNNYFGLVPTVAIGIKTGTTTAAGGNILFAAEKNVGGENRTIIGAALGQFGRNGVANIDEVTGVVRKLIEAAQDTLTSKTFVRKGDVVGHVDDGLGGTTPVVATEDVSAVGWSGLTVKLRLDGPGDGSVPHTAKAGTEVGTLVVGDGSGGDAVEVPVALQEDLAEPGLTARLTRLG